MRESDGSVVRQCRSRRLRGHPQLRYDPYGRGRSSRACSPSSGWVVERHSSRSSPAGRSSARLLLLKGARMHVRDPKVAVKSVVGRDPSCVLVAPLSSYL